VARKKRLTPENLVRLKLASLVVAPLVLLNLSVAFFGNSVVSPLSPYFLREKAHALKLYLRHRQVCFWSGHPELGPLVADAERKHHIPRHLLAALIEVESEGRPHRISFAGAMGLGQIVPATADLLRLVDPFDSATAIDASARYISRQLERLKSPRLALAAYNAGPGNVNGVVPHNGETEHYVEKVMRAYDRKRAGNLKSLP